MFWHLFRSLSHTSVCPTDQQIPTWFGMRSQKVVSGRPLNFFCQKHEKGGVCERKKGRFDGWSSKPFRPMLIVEQNKSQIARFVFCFVFIDPYRDKLVAQKRKILWPDLSRLPPGTSATNPASRFVADKSGTNRIQDYRTRYLSERNYDEFCRNINGPYFLVRKTNDQLFQTISDLKLFSHYYTNSNQSATSAW